MSKSTLLILGNQLFSLDIIQATSTDSIFMAEDLGLCTYEKHHKLKILMFLAAMRENAMSYRQLIALLSIWISSIRLLISPMKISYLITLPLAELRS